jgi:two-component system nitrate/nitrite response regulator NarL
VVRGKAVVNAWKFSLTPREYEVALLVGRGLSNKGVARELGLSEGTVKLHVHKIFHKLGARNRYALISAVYRSEGDPRFSSR